MNLFEYNLAIEEAFARAVDEETGEIISDDVLQELNALELGRDEKISNIGRYIKNLEADAEAYKAQKQRFDALQKSATKKIESLKNYLSFALDGQKWDSDPEKAFKIGWRKSANVVTVDNIDEIPLEFFKTPRTESNLNKTMIKEAILNDGVNIGGVHLQDNNNIQIK